MKENTGSPIWFKPKWKTWCKTFLLNIVAEENNNNFLMAAEKQWIYYFLSDQCYQTSSVQGSFLS